MKKRIILDTDIGCDPDDIIALLLALNSPELKIELIVTSDEHKGHRFMFVKNILDFLNSDIRVVQGESSADGKYCLACFYPDSETDRRKYISEVKRVIEKNRKTYYICIGSQTNLALFLDKVPELMPKMEVLMMGGAINYRKKNTPEHNIKRDIAAALKVFHSAVKKRYVISDTTFTEDMAVDKNHPIYRKIQESNSPAKTILLDNINHFFQKFHPRSLMHDPLTLSVLIDPRFVAFTEKRIMMNNRGVMSLTDEGLPTIISDGAKHGEFMKFLEQRIKI